MPSVKEPGGLRSERDDRRCCKRVGNAAVSAPRMAATICQPSRPSVAAPPKQREMRDMLRTMLSAISAAWVKRQHDNLRDKIEDNMVADLEAIVANMKRAREHVERGQNEMRRTA